MSGGEGLSMLQVSRKGLMLKAVGKILEKAWHADFWLQGVVYTKASKQEDDQESGHNVNMPELRERIKELRL